MVRGFRSQLCLFLPKQLTLCSLAVTFMVLWGADRSMVWGPRAACGQRRHVSHCYHGVHGSHSATLTRTLRFSEKQMPNYVSPLFYTVHFGFTLFFFFSMEVDSNNIWTWILQWYLVHSSHCATIDSTEFQKVWVILKGNHISVKKALPGLSPSRSWRPRIYFLFLCAYLFRIRYHINGIID